MHAHTRAIEIRNFTLPPTSKSIDELKFYFETYLRGKGNGQLDSNHNPLTSEVYYGFMDALDRFDPTGRLCNKDTTSPDIHNMHWSNRNLDDPDEHVLIDRDYQDFLDNLDYISDYEYIDSKRHHPLQDSHLLYTPFTPPPIYN